jgi:hypothetical protein
MARRAIAVVIALALIGISIAVRALVFDDDTSSGATQGGGTQRLTCVTELAGACRAIADASNGHVQVTVEPAGITADRLVRTADGTDAGTDGWLTLAPWPDIVRIRREAADRGRLLGPTSRRLARSPLVIAIRRDRLAALSRACRGRVDWTCVGNHAGQEWSQLGGDVTWGKVKPAHAEPVQHGSGLLVLGQAVGDFLATPDVPVERVSSTEWEASDTFPGWFQRLETSVPPDAFADGADPFTRWLQQSLANYSLVGGVEAEIGPGLARSALKGNVTVIYPAPVASADVVFAPVGGGGNQLAKTVAERDAATALARSGWRVPAEPPAPGVGTDPLPASNGLPRAGTLDALQDLWQQVVR